MYVRSMSLVTVLMCTKEWSPSEEDKVDKKLEDQRPKDILGKSQDLQVQKVNICMYHGEESHVSWPK